MFYEKNLMDGETLSPYIFLFMLLLIPFHVIGLSINSIQAKLFLPFKGPRGSLGTLPYDLRNH